MAGVHIAVTGTMVAAATIALRGAPGAPLTAGDVRKAIEAALAAAEISMGDDGPTTVLLTFTNHQKDVETVRLPIGAKHAYDFGPRGLAFRKVQVTR
jgi:hypothetical protein